MDLDKDLGFSVVTSTDSAAHQLSKRHFSNGRKTSIPPQSIELSTGFIVLFKVLFLTWPVAVLDYAAFLARMQRLLSVTSEAVGTALHNGKELKGCAKVLIIHA